MRSNVLRPLTAVAHVGLAALLATTASAAEWPQFRGPDGSGVVADADLPLKWSESAGVVWKTAVPGKGWSSPVHAGGRIWLTTAEATPLDDLGRATLRLKLALNPMGGAMEGAASITLSAVEIDASNGKVLRTIKLFDVETPEAIHGLNSYASPTPVLDGNKCLCHFGTNGTACVDASSGKVLWTRKLEIDHIVGPGSSPIVVDGLAIIPCDGGDKQYVVALDMTSGEPRWQVDRPPIRSTVGDMRKAFSTPLLIKANGRETVVIPGAQWFVAYDPADGKEVWRVDHGDGFSNVPRPVFDGDKVFLCTGFARGELWAVRADGKGDVGGTHVAWKETSQVPTMPSPVVADGRVYMINDAGVATCLDAETGKNIWRERIGGNFSSSSLLGASRVYFTSQDGRTTVVAASDKFEKLAENSLDGQVMASPAVVDGDLLLRTDTHLYRIGGE